MEKFFIPKGPMVDYTFLDEATGEDMTGKKSLKSYGDSYLYSKYPMYNKQLLDAIMQDPMIDKKSYDHSMLQSGKRSLKAEKQYFFITVW